MSEQQGKPRRRPGPVGFHAESKVTTQSHGPGKNDGGIAEAAGPTKATPTGSKELKVVGTGVWAAIAVLVVVLGVVLLSPIVIILGIVGVAGAYWANHANRTESRLRDESANGGSD